MCYEWRKNIEFNNRKEMELREMDWRSKIVFNQEKDCPKNKKCYDNDCYDCDWHIACLGKIEDLYK